MDQHEGSDLNWDDRMTAYSCSHILCMLTGVVAESSLTAGWGM